MASTYSPDLRIELIGTGDQAGNWGSTTNTNLGTLIENAIVGVAAVSVVATPQALTAANGLADQARQATLVLTTTTTANFSVLAPPTPKQYVVYNNTAYVATLGNATAVNGTTPTGGATITVAAGKIASLWTDGTNFFEQNTGFATTAANTFTGAQNTARATVASHATTADIWAAAGNQINWTGTATTTAFPNAPQGGAERTLICAAACSFTASANMLIDGLASAATVTCAANDKIIVRAITTTQFMLSRVKADGTAQVAPVAGMTLGTPVVTTSGTAVTFTGIPAGVKLIAVHLKGVSTNGTSHVTIRIGRSGGIEESGYLSHSAKIPGGGVVPDTVSVTSSFISNIITAAAVRGGVVFLALENSATFSWTCSGSISDSSNSVVATVTGSKSLSSELTQVRITTNNGTDAFDAGEVNISYM